MNALERNNDGDWKHLLGDSSPVYVLDLAAFCSARLRLQARGTGVWKCTKPRRQEGKEYIILAWAFERRQISE